MIAMDTADGEHKEYARYMAGNAWLIDGKNMEGLDVSELRAGDRVFAYVQRHGALYVLIVRD